MKSKFLLLLVLVLSLASITYSEDTDELLIDCDYYWNNDSLILAPEAKPLQFYIDSAFTFSKTINKINDRLEISDKILHEHISFQVDTVGLISGHFLIDIVVDFIPQTITSELGKIILIETDSGLYKILHSGLGYSGSYKPEKSIIKSIDYFDIIYTKSRYYGQQTMYVEHYWVHSLKTNCFKRLDYFASIKDTINLLKPDSCLPYSDRFDIDSLFWSNYFWNKKDHHYNPTCGRVKVWFELNGCDLLPAKIIFNPEEKRPR